MSQRVSVTSRDLLHNEFRDENHCAGGLRSKSGRTEAQGNRVLKARSTLQSFGGGEFKEVVEDPKPGELTMARMNFDESRKEVRTHA